MLRKVAVTVRGVGLRIGIVDPGMPPDPPDERVKCGYCSRRFRTVGAVADHAEAKHGVRGRRTPKNLWAHE